MENASQNIAEVPKGCRRLPVPMPPMLPVIIGVTSDSRYFRLNYEGSKAFWSDGRAGATFTYFTAYEPYVKHLAMAIHLFDANLGSDDEPPAHALLVDRQTAAVYVGEYDEVRGFLRKQHPPRRPPTPEEIAEMDKQLAEMQRVTLDDLRELGVFEFLLGSKPEQQDRCVEMVAWLDEFITEDLINSYLAAAGAGAGDARAVYYLHRLQLRIESLHEINTSSRQVH